MIARSVLKGGFLTGKYGADAHFADPADQRREWGGERIGRLARQAQAFDFLAASAGSLHAAAIAYPLSFAAVSTVILSCKDIAQVDANLGGAEMAPHWRRRWRRIAQVQRATRRSTRPSRAARWWRRLKGRSAGG